MNTPDTEVDAYSRGYKQGRFDSEMDRLNEEPTTPDTEEKKHVAYSPEVNQIRPILVKYFNEYPADLLADLSDLLSSRDTYWKERDKKLRLHLGVILPMAKGYVHTNDVGRNREMVSNAEDFLAELDNLK